jgi:hypothetical protein
VVRDHARRAPTLTVFHDSSFTHHGSASTCSAVDTFHQLLDLSNIRLGRNWWWWRRGRGNALADVVAKNALTSPHIGIFDGAGHHQLSCNRKTEALSGTAARRSSHSAGVRC